MDKAYDAKFSKYCKDPRYPFAPLIFFKFPLIIIFCFISFVFAKEGFYEEKDITIVMTKLFNYHVENKDLNKKIVSRTLKIYLENFDIDKIYLTRDEALAFLEVDDKQIQKGIEKLKKNDFSDFHKLNQILHSAILRARKWRLNMNNDISFDINNNDLKKQDRLSYAKNEKELKKRQKQHVLRFYAAHQKRSNIDSPSKKNKVFDLYEKKIRSFEDDYLLNDSSNRLEHFFVLHFLKAFSKSLDAHTYFFSEEEAREMRVNLEKKFEGIGVILTETIDGIIISDMLKGSPAYESNKIKQGDIIVEINNKNIQEDSFENMLKAMKQKDKGRIELGLKREGIENIIRVDLESRLINMNEDRLISSYEPYGDGILGKLVLKSFYESQDGFSSEKDIKEAIEKLRSQGNLKGLVLDLRENAGGFLNQAIKVAGLFLSNGVVVISKYSNNEIKYLRTLEGATFYNGPLVILTSKMSASAAEIVAQALQDYGVGIVVGDERTFGKGSIQYQTVTNENADYFFKVTIGRYYTVSGKSTQIEGVKADIIVPSRYFSYDVGERFLEYSLSSDNIESAYSDSLQDLEPKIKKLFQRNYLPNLQKVVTIWTKMLPILKENSVYRISHNPLYKQLIEKKEDKNFKEEDFQIEEATNILKDMIILEAKSKNLLNESVS